MPFDLREEKAVTTEISRTLRAAKTVITSEARWSRGAFRSWRWRGWHSAYCADAAIWQATYQSGSKHGEAARRYLAAAISDLDGSRADTSDVSCPAAIIWRWNDHPLRTHAEVLAAFDHAIFMAEHPVQYPPSSLSRMSRPLSMA